MKPVLLLLVLLLIAVSALAQTPTTTTDFQNKVWHYSLSGYEVDITFSSDTTIHWQDKTRGETDKSKTIRINDHTLLVGWYESDKTFVSLYSDFTTGEAYCHVFRPTGAVLPMRGRLVLKK
ncbi:MoaF-related domain-containing protein [Spirosoma areae]